MVRLVVHEHKELKFSVRNITLGHGVRFTIFPSPFVGIHLAINATAMLI